MPVDTAAVIGLGLIGGSVARDLAAHGVRVLGHDADSDAVRAAIDAGVVAAPLSPAMDELMRVELVVLALPVDAALALLAELAPRLTGARLVTDVGSTKRAIVAAAERLGLGDRFVGSHPLAGDHRSGWLASRPGLFAGSRCFLCATPSATPDARATAVALWRALGAEPVETDAGAHDREMAWISHLPTLASVALALALDDAGQPRTALGPGGRDATRLAGSDAGMWAAIALENADELGPAIVALERRLADVRERIARGDREGIERLFAAGREWAEAAGA